MDISKLASKEFEQDFQETLRKINDKFHLSLQCGVISCEGEELVIRLKDANTDASDAQDKQ